ncbi:hypothetical protein [Pseudoalteromonas peptidolytica]|uniref:Uncharacterized protein n=1 Tax=Pseudoalteromonas peptidolytica F12-50-A1 TaxID=1315280 RepID=A0A8I0MT46_9GAMM|nr:hypothetical protein [Pseudoalteromonas peptidolytica]MBE0344963.1 hypothetical protein [Pseudoalteromonas peptidolytica F12-50-A1]NLR15571.1 hypothetical protein [Pseudoalteromonas peptidolytica]GEK08313.1 hypothetical protein PPE03_05620 [Pseudoalteromonas peptidolytica]
MERPNKISNSYLNDDTLFINWYLLFAAYAPIVVDYTKEARDDDNSLLGGDSKSLCLNILKNKNRVLDDRKCRILINSEFLNMDKDFLIYCFLLQKLNRKIINKKITYHDLWIDVSLKEIQDFFGIKKFNNKRYGHIFKSCLRRLRGITLDLDLKGDSIGVITGLINEVVYDKGKSAKTTYRVSFPENLIRFLEKSKRETFFTREEYNSIETFGAKKLYFYFNSIDYNNKGGFIITEFKRSTLEQVLGHKIVYLNGDDESFSNVYHRDKDISKSDISDYFDALVNSGFLISWSYSEESDNYHVFQSRHVKEYNKEKNNQRNLTELEEKEKSALEDYVRNNEIEIVFQENSVENELEQLSRFLNSDMPLDTREGWEKLEDIDFGEVEDVDFEL